VTLIAFNTKLSNELAVEHSSSLLVLCSDFQELNWTREHLLLDLPCKWDLSWAAFIERVPVGFIICSKKVSVAHIHLMLVGTAYRRQHIGNQLFGHFLTNVLGNAEKLGLTSLELQTNKSWKPAIEFYKRQGFTVIENLEGDQLRLRREVVNSPERQP
jgi:ribosomal protein S18 acetylase RimI-like enzyme